MNHEGIAACILASLCALGRTGCFVTVGSPATAGVYGPPVESGYRPLLYDGYVAYYVDDEPTVAQASSNAANPNRQSLASQILTIAG